MDWIVKNLILLLDDPRESYFGLKKQDFGEKIRDTSPKDDEFVGTFIPPLKEEGETDHDGQLLRWSTQKQRGSKGKEKVIVIGVKVTKTYSISGTEKKLLGDAMKKISQQLLREEG